MLKFLAFAVVGLSTAVRATDLGCETFLKDQVPAVTSRWRPAFEGDGFDVRVLSRRLIRPMFSPRRLLAQTIREIEDLKSAFTTLGFAPGAYLQVLVEAHPFAIRYTRFRADGSRYWGHNERETPWIGNARTLIAVPGWLGGDRPFWGKRADYGFAQPPMFLALTALSNSAHSLDRRRLVAHEVAHTSENPNSHRDFMWREARADLLSYLVTGETDFVFPEGTTIARIDDDGRVEPETVTVPRSLNRPRIATSAQALPNLYVSHQNSEILSSALFEIAQQLSRTRVCELIRWMDGGVGPEVIPYLRARSHPAIGARGVEANIEYVNETDIQAVREAIHDHLTRFGSLIRRWAHDRTTPGEAEQVHQILLRHLL